jgi:hypothetical protein
VKINIQNSSKTAHALAARQKRCSARTLDADILGEAIRQSEARLCNLLPKSCWKGLSLSITVSPQKIPSSYNGIPMATFATVTRHTSGWFLTNVARGRVREGGRDIMIEGLKERGDELASFLTRTVGTFELEEQVD